MSLNDELRRAFGPMPIPPSRGYPSHLDPHKLLALPLRLEVYIEGNHDQASRGMTRGHNWLTPYDQLVEAAMPIILTEGALNKITSLPISPNFERHQFLLDHPMPFDLPSSVVWLESRQPLFELPTNDPRFGDTLILGMMVEERATDRYFVDLIGFRKVNETGQTQLHLPKFILGPNEGADAAILHIWLFIHMFCRFLNDAQEGQSRVDFRTKIGSGQDRRRFELKQITYMRPREEKDSRSKEEETTSIEWSHRWKVRGHWRRVLGIGRDRTGEYRINGATWVREHIRGPEDKVLLNKKRILLTREGNVEVAK